MANGVATELRSRGYAPDEFTMLAYGGNGPLHCCGIANALNIRKVLAPPFASVFSALGAGNVDQLHIHEMSTFTVLFDTNKKSLLTTFETLNDAIEELELRGREDLVRQGVDISKIQYRIEFDMRYGNQRVETPVVSPIRRFKTMSDVLTLIRKLHERYGEQYGEGSQAAEAGVRINTIRVASFLTVEKVDFSHILPVDKEFDGKPVGKRDCHFVGISKPVETRIYDDRALIVGTSINGPALVTTEATTYLVEPGWNFHSSNHGAVWFNRLDSGDVR